MKLHHAEFTLFKIEPKTEWGFAEIYDSEGNSTLIELTSAYDPNTLITTLIQALVYLKTHDLTEVNIESLLGYSIDQLNTNLLDATIVSAIKTSITQLESEKDNLRIDHYLGSFSKSEKVPLYANINRATFHTERKPSDFANYAVQAAENGFKTIKLAPFDEIDFPASLEDCISGFDRIEAVRNAVGNEIEVLIDCHSKFDYQTAISVADKLQKYNISWFEESVEPDPYSSKFELLSNKLDVPLAGGELIYGTKFFELLCKQGYDILMPDIKYCGGITEAVNISKIVASFGKTTSLHNPSGPVSMLASAYTTLALSNPGKLEHAVYESPWRKDILNPQEVVKDGNLYIPNTKGFPSKIDHKALVKYGKKLSQ